jgi:hypothetical protein
MVLRRKRGGMKPRDVFDANSFENRRIQKGGVAVGLLI